ncbi:MAG: DUF1697 domain-containing protein [Gemmatimonadota bacterium]
MADVQVALFRGINVGRAKRIRMADLRALLTELGYGAVRTLLNSGNAVFTVAEQTPAAETAVRIHTAVAERLGVSSRVTVLTAAELDEIVEQNPLLEVADNPARLLSAVLEDPADRRHLLPLLERSWEPEALALGPRVAYLWCPHGIAASQLPEAVDRALRKAVTSRNWATILKIHALTNTRD